MKIAALYDIHGNLPALEAVLREVDLLNVDQIVVGGDVVVGPMSHECFDLLLSHPKPMHFIQGNCEVAVLNVASCKPVNKLPESVMEDIKWTANQFDQKRLDVMHQWPMTTTLEIDGIGKTLFLSWDTAR